MNADPVTVMRRRFPNLVFWFGARTHVWWALMPPPSGWRLIEAADPEQLTRAVIEAQSWPWPSPRRGARWIRGTGDAG